MRIFLAASCSLVPCPVLSVDHEDPLEIRASHVRTVCLFAGPAGESLYAAAMLSNAQLMQDDLHSAAAVRQDNKHWSMSDTGAEA